MIALAAARKVVGGYVSCTQSVNGTYRSSRIDRSSRIVAVSPCPPNISASQIAATVGAIWRVPSSVTR